MTTKFEQQSDGLSRRKFLGAFGSSAVTLGTAGVIANGAAQGQTEQRRRFVLREDRFTRLFENLPPFAAPSEKLAMAMLEVGKPGGILDAKDDLSKGPVLLITDLGLSANNQNNNTHTAGTTFMGQFMDHDMTFDLQSRLGTPTDPEDSPNARTPAFDLDTVYGGGPARSPELYQRADRGPRVGNQSIKLRVESGGLFEDLPRTRSDTAIIGDPRNDENLMIAGLHAAFLLFHNKAVDLVAARDRRDSPDELFRKARRLTTWHYQWMIVHEFLPLFIGQSLVNDILARGRRFYRPPVGVIPVEFQGAAYRFGHSMVRPSYRANLKGDNGQAFFGMIFDPAGEEMEDPVDLRGDARAPRRFIGWQTFFDFGDGEMRPNKTIDTRISTPLFNLPLGAIPGGTAPTALPQRNLLRHITWQLPSGQSIAQHMRVPALSARDLEELRSFGLNLETSTPLWYYVLKEAQVAEKGLRLGPVGGRIVGEVIIGLLQLDRNSYLAASPRWRPTLPDRRGGLSGDFRMIDFLTFAGVDPVSRGQ
jgi:Animal haem peroxidase